MGKVIELFKDAPEPNSTQAFYNCYEEATAAVTHLSEIHALDYEGAVIATIAALLDEAELAADTHEAAQRVIDFVTGRCKDIQEDN